MHPRHPDSQAKNLLDWADEIEEANVRRAAITTWRLQMLVRDLLIAAGVLGEHPTAAVG